MTTLTVTSKGQVTLRKEVLRHLGVGPGGKIDVELRPGRTIEIKSAEKDCNGSVESFIGRFAAKDGPRLTLQEIKTAIEEGYAGIRRDDPDTPR